MARKARTTYICQECGYSTPKWLGRCPDCGSWGTLEEAAFPSRGDSSGSTALPHSEVISLAPQSPAAPITKIDPNNSRALATGIGELDRVLGQGIIPGSVVLLAGEPGVGKSTLLLEVASQWVQAQGGRRALYVTAEESAAQVRGRAERTGALHEELYLAAESNLDVVGGHVTQLRPTLLIVDSVQTLHAPGVEGVPGGVAQSRAVTATLTTIAKSTGIPVLLVGHVTKDGAVAGPRVLEHLVDVVLHFEGDRHSSLRMLRGIKNRFGATDEVGCFEQDSTGIKEVPDPSGLFLSHRGHTPDGSAITVALDGVRPMLVEVQSLVVNTESKNPRRVVSGLDGNRVPMVLAVLAKRTAMKTQRQEVYVATVGGVRIHDPATDLAVALATASTHAGQPLPPKTVALGEIGLSGEIRRVPNLQRRVHEAARLGYVHALIPAGSQIHNAGLKTTEVADISQALAAVGLGS
ncbi:DNA repair protein RadA [Corynebacterium poyangense]|uniref:DNA repair protein RadA n=1 Tax=Corynebacterium poyangense TaxID=2684405 RepID=A0A7H0SR36_9CORY|nr:DNA repair protein RadA [Corynebacterium poyangense]MBZ8176437.1 DNA repair protein RadA [Corynebacterium poyangense]QNQ91011.1 DNA repair protein RadA [Corynebacterium poyangense]